MKAYFRREDVNWPMYAFEFDEQGVISKITCIYNMGSPKIYERSPAPNQLEVYTCQREFSHQPSGETDEQCMERMMRKGRERKENIAKLGYDPSDKWKESARERVDRLTLHDNVVRDAFGQGMNLDRLISNYRMVSTKPYRVHYDKMFFLEHSEEEIREILKKEEKCIEELLGHPL